MEAAVGEEVARSQLAFDHRCRQVWERLATVGAAVHRDPRSARAPQRVCDESLSHPAARCARAPRGAVSEQVGALVVVLGAAAEVVDHEHEVGPRVGLHGVRDAGREHHGVRGEKSPRLRRLHRPLHRMPCHARLGQTAVTSLVKEANTSINQLRSILRLINSDQYFD